MNHLIISTCGTSIFSGGAPTDIRQLLIEHANVRRDSDIVEISSRQRIVEHTRQRQQELRQTTDMRVLCARSAEIAALSAYYGGQFTRKDQHILLATDTWLCEQSAQTIAAVLEAKGQAIVEIKRLTDLRTDDLAAYRQALSELVKWLYQIIPGYRQANYKIVFNLTGGFKGVQGFMQTLGALLADECVYVFERSEQLIRMPRLPLQLQPEPYIRNNLRVCE